mmetsp:Transcript_9657/g.17620  ORF Transcript_9657/g.17620 Transcript_9657/m.17620 type:complete len:147 (-) Transcript_9657:47-487(-)
MTCVSVEVEEGLQLAVILIKSRLLQYPEAAWTISRSLIWRLLGVSAAKAVCGPVFILVRQFRQRKICVRALVTWPASMRRRFEMEVLLETSSTKAMLVPSAALVCSESKQNGSIYRSLQIEAPTDIHRSSSTVKIVATVERVHPTV